MRPESYQPLVRLQWRVRPSRTRCEMIDREPPIQRYSCFHACRDSCDSFPAPVRGVRDLPFRSSRIRESVLEGAARSGPSGPSRFPFARNSADWPKLSPALGRSSGWGPHPGRLPARLGAEQWPMTESVANRRIDPRTHYGGASAVEFPSTGSTSYHTSLLVPSLPAHRYGADTQNRGDTNAPTW